jgi:peptidoglycan/LPS O-acetylase OafA/YrhL
MQQESFVSETPTSSTRSLRFSTARAGAGNYIASLDGLRGISIVLVLLSHASIPGFRDAGGIGVDIFFVLSGYLITTILLREHERTKSISLKAFYKKRSLRLLPALLLMSLLFATYSVVCLPELSARLRETGESLLYVTNWSRAFEFGTSQFLGHTWSLGIEEQFYVLWPVLLIALLKLSPGRTGALIVILTLAAAALLWRMWLAYHGAGIMRIYNGFDTRCDCVLTGCALAFVAGRVASLWPLGAAGIILTLVTYEMGYFLPLTAGYTVNAICAAFLIAGAMQKETSLSRMLSLLPIVWTGRISYGLYIFHFPVYLAMARQFQLGGWALDAAALGLTVTISVLSYRFAELPCLLIRDSAEWSNATRHLAYAGPFCLALGMLYVMYNLL